VDPDLKIWRGQIENKKVRGGRAKLKNKKKKIRGKILFFFFLKKKKFREKSWDDLGGPRPPWPLNGSAPRHRRGCPYS
jgi:hypothetical protein